MAAIVVVLLAALATWQAVEVIHHAQIAQPIRTWARDAAAAGGVWAFFGKAIECPFCLSHWVALTMVVVLSPQSSLFMWALMTLAAARLANVANDVIGGLGFDRTPKDSEPTPDHP